jgi:hypothetical protein
MLAVNLLFVIEPMDNVFQLAKFVQMAATIHLLAM